MAALPALTRQVEGSTPSGPTARRSEHASRITLHITTLLHTFRDRLAGRTLASEPRKTGSNPVPGTDSDSFARERRPRSLKTWRLMARRARASVLFEFELARSSRRPDRPCATSLVFQRSRMVRQPAVNRVFEGSIPSAGAFLPTREGHTRKTMLVRIQPRGPILETASAALDESRRKPNKCPPRLADWKAPRR